MAEFDKGRRRRYTAGIEWRTYTPDGRVLVVRRTESGWVAACDGDEFESERLADAMRDAVGYERGETLQLGRSTHDTIAAWVAEQSARIEREAGTGAG
jgi:hypothetical protein